MKMHVESKNTEKDNAVVQGSCSLCGQLYHSFAFKAGYICEDCLRSIKTQDSVSRHNIYDPDHENHSS